MRRAPAATTEVLEVTGGAPRRRGFTHTAVPDRLEVASWTCAAIATGGEITVWGARQQDMMTFLKGISIIHEPVHEDRFGQRNYLHSAVVAGPKALQAADVAIPGLRGGFSYVIAALVAEGTSTLPNTGIIRRGYEDFVTRLQSVGGKVRA